MNVSAEVLLCISILVMFSFTVFVMYQYRKLALYTKLQADMRERISVACEMRSAKESIPVLAIERFMTYINHPDPTFDPALIIKQEQNNQLFDIGPAKE